MEKISLIFQRKCTSDVCLLKGGDPITLVEEATGGLQSHKSWECSLHGSLWDENCPQGQVLAEKLLMETVGLKCHFQLCDFRESQGAGSETERRLRSVLHANAGAGAQHRLQRACLWGVHEFFLVSLLHAWRTCPLP